MRRRANLVYNIKRSIFLIKRSIFLRKFAIAERA